MKYSIGLDVGIASVGYAVIMLDGKDEPCRIVKMGSRIFEAAEHLKDGSSLAAPRREKRGLRRRLRRKRFRKERIRNLIEKYGIMKHDEIDRLYECTLSDIYEIRSRALDEKLSKEEFVRLLIHLSQRRGFKSNRKVDSNNKKSDTGLLLAAVEENKNRLIEKGYRTIGEMIYKDEKFSQYKRNKAESYSNTFARQDYANEINVIFEKQREFDNEHASEELEKEYLEIYLSQRSFDDGPGGDSPYGGNQIENMLGKCTFEMGEPRAVKASFSFEYFSLLSKINATKIVWHSGKRSLTDDEREAVKSLAFSKKSISYASIRKELGMAEDELFNITYGNGDRAEVEKKNKFEFLSAYHTLKKAFGDGYASWDVEKKNHIGYALTVFKNDDKIKKYLSENGFSELEINIALTVPAFTKTGNLSIKALNKIIPHLEKGMLYNEACEAAGYNFKADEKCCGMYLPANSEKAEDLQNLKNPVVRRAVSQTIKVINAVIREMGESPCFVNIELAREMSKNFNDRRKIKKVQDENRDKNEQIMDRLRMEFGLRNPTGQDIIKLSLWEEQDGICPYTLKTIELDRLFDTGYTDIDHIIPYSVCFDDSRNNKVLVFSSANREKSNRIPMQYVNDKDAFKVWVENSHLKWQKKKKLLKETLTEEDVEGFKQRNLQDTQYISRFMLNFIKKYLEFSPNSTGRKKLVQAVNGAATSYVRKRWGISKIRENGDTHHAIDAVVIACITEGMTKRISEYSKYHETDRIDPEFMEYYDIDRKTGEVVNRFPMPYPWFRKELEILCSNDPTRALHENPLPNYGTDEELKPIFVSRMPRHKITGSAHMETVQRNVTLDDKHYTVTKVPLSSLKLNKNGEIDGYYNPSSDRLLYEALKARLAMFGGKGEAAFKDDFFKPKSDGTNGPKVNKVKVMNKSTMSVPVMQNTAVADNGSMVRVDVFRVEGEGYYLVPVYVSDTVKDKLPDRAIVAYKSIDEWKKMDDKNFLFSLYPNDLIRVKSKKNMTFSLVNKKDSTLDKNRVCNDMFLYYKGTGISTASIKVINHDNTYTIDNMGVKTLLSIEKYQVDVLGNISKVEKEKRVGFSLKNKKRG